MMKIIYAIIIEEDEDLAKLAEHQFNCFFEAIGFKLVASYADGGKNALKIIHNRGPEKQISVVISDIMMGGTDESRGLLWIQDIKKRHPELFVIGISGKEICYRPTLVRIPSFDMYIDKIFLQRGDERVINHKKREFLEKYRWEEGLTISPESSIPSRFSGGHKNLQLNALLKQVLFSGHDSDEMLRPDLVTVSQLSGGYSGSFVFKLSVSFADGTMKAVPSVLKVSKLNEAREEAANYKKFVRWLLPYSWRVEMLAEAYTKDFGAVCYSFVSSENLAFDSVTAYIREGKPEAIGRVISKVFSPDARTWYSERLCRMSETDLTHFYTNQYFPSADSLARATRLFSDKSQLHFDAIISKTEVVIPGMGTKIKEPSSILFGRSRGKFLTTICHGDMNSNNILLAGNDAFVFIDFQQTGRMHVYADFITFEHSIRLHYPCKVDPKDIPRFESLISSQDALQGFTDPKKLDDLPDLYKLILQIRRAALKNFSEEPFDNYIYGATVFSLRLLRVEDFDDSQVSRLLGQLFSGMSHLG